jgi:hypothetical protein
MPILAAQWHLGQVFLSMLWFALFVIWIGLLFTVFRDVFRSHDLGGLAKALWLLFVIVLPYLGVVVYFIARGDKMPQHNLDAARARRGPGTLAPGGVPATPTSPATELARLAQLKEQGVIDDQEFDRLKAKAMS